MSSPTVTPSWLLLLFFFIFFHFTNFYFGQKEEKTLKKTSLEGNANGKVKKSRRTLDRLAILNSYTKRRSANNKKGSNSALKKNNSEQK